MTDQRIPEAAVIVTEAFDGVAVPRWQRMIDQAVELCPDRLTVDLRRCPLVDAAAIEVLLRAHRRMIGQGGRLVLCAPPPRVRRVLRLARLEQVFEIVERPPGSARIGAPPDGRGEGSYDADRTVAV
jgi:anti-anti-sigma factor